MDICRLNVFKDTDVSLIRQIRTNAHKALRYITLTRWHVSSAVLKYTNARVRARIDLRDHEIIRDARSYLMMIVSKSRVR